jgi:hypothetical protein
MIGKRKLDTLALAVVMTLAVATPSPASGHGRGASALRVVEGTVEQVGEAVAEGDLAVVTVRLRDTGEELQLAPASVLEELDFPVEPGDEIKARVFPVEESGAAPAQKVFNLTKGRMLRLRTMRRDPLWDGSGRWQGGTCEDHGRGGRPPDDERGPGRGQGGRHGQGHR